jgi:hypothetical protein
MSGHGIHVHGAHDHAVEHEAHKGGLGQQIAIFAAVLATVGAIVSFFGGDTQNDALLFKNEAVLERAEASDPWYAGEKLHPHSYLSISMTLLQIAIALASITVLTQKRWLLGAAAVSALGGALLGIAAWI